MKHFQQLQRSSPYWEDSNLKLEGKLDMKALQQLFTENIITDLS